MRVINCEKIYECPHCNATSLAASCRNDHCHDKWWNRVGNMSMFETAQMIARHAQLAEEEMIKLQAPARNNQQGEEK